LAGRYQLFLIARDNLAYEIKTLGSITINKNTPISPMPLPEEDSDENILMKIEGNSTTMNVSWTMVESTNCIGNSTFTHTGTEWQVGSPDTAKSSSVDQLKWLERDFAPNNLSDFYQILVLDSGISSSVDDAKVYEKFGIFQGFNFTTDSSSPVIWNCSFDFIEGNVVTTLGGNVHEAGSIQSASWGAGNPPNQVTINCKEYQNYVSGDRPDTTAIVLRYKETGGIDFWRENELSVTANTTSPYNYSEVFSVGVESGKYYTFRIAFINSGGRGEWSNNFEFTTITP